MSKFKITSNINQVNIQINKSLKAKMGAVEKATDVYIDNVERDAKKNITTNNSIYKGNLLNSFRKKKGKKEKVLWVNNEYAPFVEWGTKKHFKLDQPQMASFAARFKGKKTKSNVKDLHDWAKSKGMDAKTRFKVISSILKHGTRPKPFFYRSVFDNMVSLRKDLKRAIRKRR